MIETWTDGLFNSLIPRTTDPHTVAYYLRLSNMDGDLGRNGKNESNSIENQRHLLEEYHSRCENLGGNPKLKFNPDEFKLPHREYVDDGYTGTNFKRPGFQELLSDCRKGLVSTILVKDLSRLGRNYIEVGDYIEQIFPLLGVRFISINDHFDTGTSIDGTMGLGMAVENLVNTFYVKDIARKARAARQIKWKNGQLTNRGTPLGYVCNSLEEGWVVDEGAAEIVRFIFHEAEKGHGTRMIAETLNEYEIPTPYLYLKSVDRWNGPKTLVVPDDKRLWDSNMVLKILQDESYTGTLLQGKTQSLILGSSRVRRTKDEERYRTENAHEAIVSEETFRKAQRVIHSLTPAEYINERDYALKGVARCGNCRKTMEYSETSRGEYLICGGRRQKKSDCCRERIDYDMVEHTVLVSIRQMGLLCGELLERLEEAEEWTFNFQEAETKIKSLQAQQVREYENYIGGRKSKEQFIKEKSVITAEIADIKEQIADAEVQISHEKEVADELDKVKNAGETLAGKVTEKSSDVVLTRRMVTELIEAVYIYDKEHIEVIFKAEDTIREAIEECGLGVV